MTETNAALLDDRRVLRASGSDVRELLQRLVTGNVEKVSPGTGVYSLLLTPQGKFLFDFFMAAEPGGSGILIDVAASRAGDLKKRLTMYKLRADAAFEDVSDDWSVMAFWPGAPDGPAGSEVFADPRYEALGMRAIVPASGAPAATADAAAYNNFVASMGVPDGAVDIRAEGDFPIECNLDLLNGIDFKKGCFVGQEVASRAHRKAVARKRLVTAALDGPAPAPGDDIRAGEAKVGTVASVHDDTVLALVFLDRVAKAGTTEVATGDAQLSLSVPPYGAFSLTESAGAEA